MAFKKKSSGKSSGTKIPKAPPMLGKKVADLMCASGKKY